MLFFRSFSASKSLSAIEGARVILRAPVITDFEEWAALRRASAEFLRPWEPLWPDDDLTRIGFRRRLLRYEQDIRDDVAYPLLVIDREANKIVGGVTLANVRRGVAQAGSLGYWVGEPFAHKGYMSAALQTLMPFVFDGLRLHRIEAACIPANIASKRLLEKSGFQHEGLARRYLCINGVWQDHFLYARLKSDIVA